MLVLGEVTAAGIGAIMAGLVGVAALIESVRKWVVRNNEASQRTLLAVEGITSTLNHLDEPVGKNPTVGQMIGRIDSRVDRVETKIDQIHRDVQILSNTMLTHMSEEQHWVRDVDHKIRDLENNRQEANRGQGVTD